jgi:hypothetical protein
MMMRIGCPPTIRLSTARILGAAATAIAAVVVLVVFWKLLPFFDRHEGTAAWVQAAGGILIIGATAWIASRNSREAWERERRAERQLWESIAGLARDCLSAIDGLLEKHPMHQTSDGRGSFLRAYAPSDFEIPMDGLAAVPLHQIGDASLITAVLTLRGIMGRIKAHLDLVQGDAVVSPMLEDVRNQRTAAFNAVAGVLRIVGGYAAESEISRLASRSSW